MTTAALQSIFLPILRKAGRWLIWRLVRWGTVKVITFIGCRIDVFRDRLKRAKTKRRKAWLRWRISWRRKILRWLLEHRSVLTSKAVKALDRGIDETNEWIPWDAVGERYRTWNRKYI